MLKLEIVSETPKTTLFKDIKVNSVFIIIGSKPTPHLKIKSLTVENMVSLDSGVLCSAPKNLMCVVLDAKLTITQCYNTPAR
jgi:hypothetical protein